MKLGERIKTMGLGFPDMGAIRSDLNDKFEELKDELRQIRAVLEQIRDKGAPA